MKKSKKILIVDDEEDVLTYLKAIFNDNGYDTVAARNGINGFELAQSEKPDLVTLDITMPKQSGLKMYRQLKDNKELKNIPIIIITAHDDFLGIFLNDLKEYALPEGIFNKPIVQNKILELINNILSD